MKRVISFFLVLFFISFVYSVDLKGQNTLIEGIYDYKLIVKFNSAFIDDYENNKPLLRLNLLQHIQKEDLDFINQFTYNQVLSYTPAERVQMKSGHAKVELGRFDHFEFRGMAYVAEAEAMDRFNVLKLAEDLEKFSFVEYAAIEPLKPIEPPSMMNQELASMVAETPNFEHLQLYKRDKTTVDGNTIIGIDIDYAHSLGVTGAGVTVADIEWGFDYEHEDLKSPTFVELVETTNHSSDDHGTAVAGVLISKNNGFGVTGTVYNVDKFYGISEITKGRVYGITEGLKVLQAGDIFIYEMQAFGADGKYVPADYNQAVWDITKRATDNGVIVVAAAGNGNVNLDIPAYNAYRARGDNGAIIVGASTKIGLNKASFSTYGSPVHVQGWGDWSVATTGYGDIFEAGSHRTYTGRFSGTSSATPIVSSAVIALQSYARKSFKQSLSPKKMRSLLISTGTPQGSGGHIGPLPNVRRAIAALKKAHW